MEICNLVARYQSVTRMLRASVRHDPRNVAFSTKRQRMHDRIAQCADALEIDTRIELRAFFPRCTATRKVNIPILEPSDGIKFQFFSQASTQRAINSAPVPPLSSFHTLDFFLNVTRFIQSIYFFLLSILPRYRF